jgi:Restriction endonuclease NotI
MVMPKHPLAEVFGYPIDNFSEEAVRHRELRLCRFGNKVPNCTKDKANDPLGVCTVLHHDDRVITCPIRFRENWLIAEDAAKFFFPKKARWTSLTEVRLNDRHDRTAGNIDIVLVSYDQDGRVVDFGALEVQAVYISGNIRNPFTVYMENPETNAKFDWSEERNYPHPDYLSSSRKRLAPQLLYKGGILNSWGKKTAVALNRGFYETLPPFEPVTASEGEIAWLVYDLTLDHSQNLYKLVRDKIVYTKFSDALQQITVSEPGNINEFVEKLQTKLDAKLSHPPDAPTLDQIV